jgi:Ca2+-binding EF-hand superfamily protein
LWDEGQNGFLRKEDLRAVLDKNGLFSSWSRSIIIFFPGFTKVSQKELDDLFRDADVTNSGKIGFTEFMTMMAKKMKMVVALLFGSCLF